MALGFLNLTFITRSLPSKELGAQVKLREEMSKVSPSVLSKCLFSAGSTYISNEFLLIWLRSKSVNMYWLKWIETSPKNPISMMLALQISFETFICSTYSILSSF